MRSMLTILVVLLCAVPVDAGRWHNEPRAYAYISAIDSSLAIDLSYDVWVPVENAAGTFYNELVLDKFITAGDTLVYPRSAGYYGSFALSIIGDDVTEFKVRVSGGEELAQELLLTIPKHSAGTSITIPFYDEAEKGERLYAEIKNITDDSDIIVTHALFVVAWLHD